IVHLHFPNPLAEVSYLLSRHKAPLVISYHSDVLRPKRLYKFYLPILRRLLRRADRIIVASPSLLSGSARLKRFQHKCAVIPYGIRLSDYELSPARKARAEGLKEKYGDRIVLFVGRLVYYKGVETLLEAMTNIDGRLLLIGNGPLEAALRRKCADLNLEGKVSFLGEAPQEELISAYHACRVFVLPSTEKVEAFGMVQVEAMACGKPVVSTRLPTGVPWVNQDGVTGRVVPPRDPAALARAVNELLDNSSLADQMGRRGRERAENFFSKETMVSEYAKVYRALHEETDQDRGPPAGLLTRFFKRCFDIFLSGIGIVLAFPLGCLFALAIRCGDRGPVFYLQERVGKGGRVFRLIKFRSMVASAETGLPLQASRNDPRVTRVGRFLRATAMDELPQL
ncbi:MAG: glycosyltransferase, partial [Candidatus Binatia bacterium]